jgi:mannose/fructose/N-acetylgalactosamine-specific phosphotransferase system component IID
MTTPATLSPATRWASIVGIWVAAALCAVATALFVEPGNDAAWLSLSLGGCIIGSLCAQLATREKRGFVARLLASIMGAVAVLAIAAVVLALLHAS